VTALVVIAGLLAAALIVVATLLLSEIGRSRRAEYRAARQQASRHRLADRLREYRRANVRLRNELADLRAGRVIGPTYHTPRPPLAHRDDPDRTQVFRREAS
jgi:hypothetical protein